MPAALTSLAKLASSDLINAANCSGVFPIGSQPSRPRALWMSG
jgi:hypothetical protein